MGNEELLYDLVRIGEWEIDQKGQVWKQKHGERIRVEHRTPQGYLQVRKMRNGIRIHTGAHRLVWKHFRGIIPQGLAINHKNGIKDDNRPENLEVVTNSENVKHAFRMELKTQWGESNPAVKLTNKQVVLIREVYAKGNVTQAELAKQFGVTFQTISDIARGKSRIKQPGIVADYTKRRQRPDAKRNEKGQFIS